MTAEQLKELMGRVTQGEWSSGHYDDVSDEVEIGGFDGEYVASIDCDGCYDELTGPQISANARLIALAPSLARKVIAAEKLVDALRQQREMVCQDYGMQSAVDAALDHALTEYETTK